MSDAIYHRSGNLYVPTQLAAAPWAGGAQHGGPPAALLARAIEGTDPADMAVSRIWVDLPAGVPMVPLSIETDVIKPGRRTQSIAARLLTEDGQVVASARGLRMRRKEGLVVPDTGAPAPGSPEDGQASDSWNVDFPHFYGHALEVRYIEGGMLEHGPATAWIHQRVPLVLGEEMTPVQRVMAAADTGNGISSALPFETHLFVNPDVSVYFERQPVGEWVGIEAVTRFSDHGTAVAESVLYDQHGRIGRGIQSLYVDLL